MSKDQKLFEALQNPSQGLQVLLPPGVQFGELVPDLLHLQEEVGWKDRSGLFFVRAEKVVSWGTLKVLLWRISQFNEFLTERYKRLFIIGKLF